MKTLACYETRGGWSSTVVETPGNAGARGSGPGSSIITGIMATGAATATTPPLQNTQVPVALQ